MWTLIFGDSLIMRAMSNTGLFLRGVLGRYILSFIPLEAMSTVNLPHPQKGRRGRGSVAIIEDYRIPVHLHLTSESCHGSPTVVYNLHMIFNNLFLPVIIC